MSEPTSIRVAAAQYPLDELASFAAWTDKIERWVADGAATGARLLVFPEYGAIEIAATAGGAVAGDLAATLAAVAAAEAEAARVWSGLARRHGVLILAPSGPSRRGNAVVNAATLHAPTGKSVTQDKLIVTPFERDWGVSDGTGQRIADTDLGRIGIAICYDSEFPVLVRALTTAGAEIILIPSCTDKLSGYHRVRVAAQARALESQVVTVMSPTIGDAPWSPAIDCNRGAAGVFVPPEAALSMTGVLAMGQLDEPGWITADIDMAALRLTRTTGEMRNHADWARQPGAGSSPNVAVVDLR